MDTRLWITSGLRARSSAMVAWASAELVPRSAPAASLALGLCRRAVPAQRLDAHLALDCRSDRSERRRPYALLGCRVRHAVQAGKSLRLTPCRLAKLGRRHDLIEVADLH